MGQINRREFIKQSGTMALGLGVLSQFSCMGPKKKGAKPNLVYVFPDQFRKQAMGFWNSPAFKGKISTVADPVHTPTIDRFAQESLVLTTAISNCPLCSPHRGMLFTGQFSENSGVPLNCHSGRPVSSLREDAHCFSDVLHDKGYHCAYFGKWHLDHPTPNDPANPGHYVDPRRPAWDAYTPAEDRHGFDYWYSYGTFDVHKEPHYYDNEGKRHEPKEYSPKHEADEVISYLKNERGQRDPEKPFALFVGMNPPHSPYKSLDDCMEKDYNLYKDQSSQELLIRDNVDHNLDKTASAPYYFANVTGVDREFGRILKALEEQGLTENTIVVFTSDHGETMCSQGINDPKNNIYSEAFDVPFLIRWPEKIKPRTDDLLMGTPDIMPTMLAMMGMERDIPQEVEGFNYADVFLDEKSTIKRPQSALYVKNVNGDTNEKGDVVSYFAIARGIKTHRYSLEFAVNKKGELTGTKLFDNQKDPYQVHNLPIEENKELVRQLSKEMGYWLKQSHDPWYDKKTLSDWIEYPA